MFEQDYIMKQMRQFARAVQQVLFNKSPGLHREAQNIIDNSLSDFLEDELDNYQSLTLSQTIETLKKDGKFDAELAYVVGDTLYKKAELEDDINKSIKYYKQAYLLFKKAMTYPKVAFPVTTYSKISQIEKKLDVSSLENVKKLVDG